jgi:hypothetical protein
MIDHTLLEEEKVAREPDAAETRGTDGSRAEAAAAAGIRILAARLRSAMVCHPGRRGARPRSRVWGLGFSSLWRVDFRSALVFQSGAR